MDEFPFNDHDVISIDHDGNGTKLLKLVWFRDIIKRHLDPIASQWFGKGIECQVLSTNGGGWQKGRVRLRLEYIPDEPPE
jgi:hypothetical protein